MEKFYAVFRRVIDALKAVLSYLNPFMDDDEEDFIVNPPVESDLTDEEAQRFSGE